VTDSPNRAAQYNGDKLRRRGRRRPAFFGKKVRPQTATPIPPGHPIVAIVAQAAPPNEYSGGRPPIMVSSGLLPGPRGLD
jgi:hypothetical protein